MLIRELTFAAIGTGFTCLATVLGAAMVFFFREDLKPATQKIFLGFAAGVMVAASVWSLLIPSMEMAEEMGQSPALPVGGGFLLGGAFLMVLDRLTPHLHIGSSDPEGLPAHLSRTTMIVLAVTLHNIPEGMAVGLAFCHGRPGHRQRRPGRGGGPGASGWGSRTSRRGPPSPSPCGPTAWAPGRAFVYGRPVRRGGARLRPAHCTGGGQRLPGHALGPFLRRRGHDLCGGGGTDPGGPPGGALPCGHRSASCAGFLVMMLLDVMLG